MLTIIGGSLITFALSLLATRLAAWRAKIWIAENKHKIKWEIIYTIFGPDPNMPPVVVPPVPEREPWFPNAPWNRKRRAVNPIYEPVVLVHPRSLAERITGSIEFQCGWLTIGGTVGYVVWAFVGAQ